MRATLTIYNGKHEYHVTGKVVKIYENGVSIDDSDGRRWFALKDRVKILKDE